MDLPKDARLVRDDGQISLKFSESEATPQLLMKHDIQVNISGFLISNTVPI
jgi:hypothetical protein